jgi:hypothetical protein
MKRTSRKPPHLSESLHRRLNSYALAASATGASLLALAQTAGAKIVYTPTHQIIKPHQPYDLDLNNDGVTDFLLSVSSNSCSNVCANTLAAVGTPPSNGVDGTWSHYDFYAAALHRGAGIGQQRTFHREGFMCNALDSKKFGRWVNVRNRYLGLKFVIHAKPHYGWARLNVNIRGYHITGILTGYAYETIQNKPIIAGKTKGPDVITVKDATLGHLARGASAIPAWREKD